jgi:hypothetical protein
MSRVYARREDTEESVLVLIRCDWCSSTLRPGAHVVDSGWKHGGFYQPGRDRATVWEACPQHTHLLDSLVGVS